MVLYLVNNYLVFQLKLIRLFLIIKRESGCLLSEKSGAVPATVSLKQVLIVIHCLLLMDGKELKPRQARRPA